MKSLWFFLGASALSVFVSVLIGTGIAHQRWRRKALYLTIALIVALSLGLLQWCQTQPSIPAVRFTTPSVGATTKQPLEGVEATVLDWRDGLHLWLGARGPSAKYQWSAAPCSVVGNSVKCPEFWIGKPGSGPITYDLVLVTADESGQTALEQQASRDKTRPGAYDGHSDLFQGTAIVASISIKVNALR